jgi:acetyltransferase-like isoleucine patch superfamily enzyme
MIIRRIKLQLFYFLIKCYNIIYFLFFPHIIRRLLFFIAGFKVGSSSVINSVRFFSFGKLVVGNNSIINSGCYLDNRRKITIGNNVVIAHDTKVYTLGHDINDDEFCTKGNEVVIEDYCVLFSNVLIMPGVVIKKGAVVLPGSVVTKNVNSMEVVGGNPAQFIKMRQKLHINKTVTKYYFSI